MTPISAGAAFQCVDCPQDIRAATSELAPASLSDSAPWLYSALSQLHEIESSGRDLPGIGDLRISEEASTKVRHILSLIEINPLPSPSLYPVSGRGAGMRWSVGTREIEFTIFDRGNAVMAKLEDSQFLDDSELTQNNPHKEINNYLRWLVGAR